MSTASGETSAAMAARDAELLFRTKKIPEIRATEAATKREIEEKKEELRQLVGKSYRDLIDSADTIVLMKTSCESISSNLDGIDGAIRSLSSLAESGSSSRQFGVNPARARVYGIASRVKYLVDTSENIWGCLDESMFLEASGRYLRASVVHGIVKGGSEVLSRFPLLRQIWSNVESLKGQISQRSRERLIDQGLPIGAYANALSAVAVIDNLDPKEVLGVFLDSRRSWIWQKLGPYPAVPSPDADYLFSILCDAIRIIRVTLIQVGELFLHVFNDLPLFYKTVLGTPPGSQLFGGIPNPEEEVKLWKIHREKLESVMESLDPAYVAESCSSWLKKCCADIFVSGSDRKPLIGGFSKGEELASAEKLIRETLDSREDLEKTQEQWLKNIFGTEVDSPWNHIRGIILKDQRDILENAIEEAFVQKIKEIISEGFEEIRRTIDLEKSIQSIVLHPGEGDDFQAYLKKPLTVGGIWFSEGNQRKTGPFFGPKQTNDEIDFRHSLNAYFGPEVSSIRATLDTKCGHILDDLLQFIDSHNSTSRLKELAPFLQKKCLATISALLGSVEDELKKLSSLLKDSNSAMDSQPPSVVVKRALFLGRLLFAIRNHSNHVPLILGSPRKWVKETNSSSVRSFSRVSSFSPSSSVPQSPRTRKNESAPSTRRQTVSVAAALFPADDSMKPKLDALMNSLRDLCIKAHNLWISWVSDGLAKILAEDLRKDDALSLTTSLPGWEVTTVKPDSSEGPVELKITLPSAPSVYITSFLFQACREIHSIGGHVLDKSTLQFFAGQLLRKMLDTYEKFLSAGGADSHAAVSEKGVLQILLDLQFVSDVLSGGKDQDADNKDDGSTAEIPRSSIRRNQSKFRPNSASNEQLKKLIRSLSQMLDPIDWATYEPYLWENEKQAYKRYAVLFGFFIQLNRMYTEVVQKLPTKTNTESNILRGYAVPRFKYLPISGPLQSAKGTSRSLAAFSDDVALRGSHKPFYSNGDRSPMSADFDDAVGFAAATPLLKSFMTQVGSRFGESTSRWGEMLPGPAAGLLSSFSTGASRSEA